MATFICVGLILVIQSIVHGQPVESPVSADAAGETTAAAASTAAADLTGAAGSVSGDEGVGSGAGALTYSIGDLPAGLGQLAANVGALGTGVGLGTAASLLGGGSGALGAGVGALGTGVELLGGGSAALGNMASTLNPIIVLGGGGRYGSRYGSGSKSRSTLTPAVREMLANNANQFVATTDDITGLGAQILLNNGRAFDAILGNVGVESSLGEGLATNAGQVRDGTIYVMQNGVDRMFGVPATLSSAVTADASTPAAIVVA